MDTTAEPNVPESALVSSAVLGDLEAFNELVLKYQDVVYSLARSILDDADSAEDAAQETFISAFQHVGGFRGGSFRCWLLRIATNTCYDFLRSCKRRRLVDLIPEDADGNEIESPPWIADPHPSVQAEVEWNEFSQALYRWMDELPAPFRSVITLIDLNGFDYAEAAHALGIPMGTVKSRLARARLRMKQRLSREPDIATEFGLASAGVQPV